jgi:hypothetical protein
MATRPSTARTNETVDRVNAVIRGNRRLTIREIADSLNLSFGTCQAILAPHKWSSGTWLLHHDNVPCDAALSVREFLAKHSILVVPHPPYSPDLAPVRLLPLPQAEEHREGETVSRRRGDTTKYDTALAGHSQTSLLDMH